MNTQRHPHQQQAHRPLVKLPAWLAALLSAIIPGLGQMLNGYFYRGLLALMSLLSTVGLWIWRINLAARRSGTFIEQVKKGFHLEPLLLVLFIGLVAMYVWTIIDAFQTAQQQKRGSLVLYLLIILIFFGLGWQIGEINPTSIVTGIEEGGQKLGQVVWPWERAISHVEERIESTADIGVPCDASPPAPNTVSPDQPYLVVDPTCGNLSDQEGEAGTELHLVGGNFIPKELVELWWEDPIGNEFRQRHGGEYLRPMADANGGFELDIIMPYRLVPPSVSEEEQIWMLQARQVAGIGPAQPSTELKLAIERMIETIFLGMMSTFFGIILAIPVSFLAARNLMSGSWISLTIYFVTRTILNIIRSIEPLIWAIIAVVVVGLGPFAGILALTLHSIAALGKLYSESIESIETGPIEAIQATGANWLQTIMYAVVPQIIPPFVSFTIYRWDINVRMSTVIGLVGGGGIGFLLVQWIRLLDYRAAGIAVWFIAITVAILDYISSEIRQRFV
jgi:phosphonate transport system permease protein